jgi:hypothetical protein
MVLLADVCCTLGDEPRAAQLYDLLLPYATRTVVTGRAVVCAGSASHSLGILARLASRPAEAERHFKDALTMNTRLGARTFAAYRLRICRPSGCRWGPPGAQRLRLLAQAATRRRNSAGPSSAAGRAAPEHRRGRGSSLGCPPPGSDDRNRHAGLPAKPRMEQPSSPGGSELDDRVPGTTVRVKDSRALLHRHPEPSSRREFHAP